MAMTDGGPGSGQEIRVEYRIRCGDNAQEYTLHLDKQTGCLLNTVPADPPDWTRLEVQQCSNCPLSVAENPHCPLALQLAQVIADWGHVFSYAEVRYEVVTAEHHFSGATTAQKILSALLGLVMATSECPHMYFLRPLARFHLPLGSPEETAFRVVSSYLLGQHLAGAESGRAEDFNSLIEHYEAIQTVNKCLAKRVADGSSEDAAINAVVLLDMLAHMVPFFARETLDSLRPLFRLDPMVTEASPD
jgi:hypothetical protein